MNTCKDCLELLDETVQKYGKKPIEKHRCKARSKSRKPADPACMMFKGKERKGNG